VEQQLGHFMDDIIYHKKQFFSMKSILIRANPHPIKQAKFIFLLALVFPGAEQTKVVIQTDAPAADVYLDGNFVAKTDAHGSLLMESLPPGTFQLKIKKTGYLSYAGSFQIGEGESKTVQVFLRRIETPASAKILQPEENTTPSEMAGAIAPLQKQSMPAVVSEPPAREETKTAVDNWPSEILIISASLAVLLVVAFLFSKRRARRMLMPESMVPDYEPAGIPAPRIKQPPEFVDQLKRREELIQSGFLSIKPEEPNHIDPREKDVVIVLPKEAYTSEEE
jgi:hypothetical protein